MYRQRRGTQRLRAGRPAGPKRAEQGRAETASYRGGTSRGDSSAPFPLPVSYKEITRRFNYYSAARVLAVQRAAANLNRAPQKARSARPPHFRPKDARGLRRRPVHAYKQAVRLKRPKKAAHRAPATRSIQKGYPPRAHTTEVYLKLPLRHLPRFLARRRPDRRPRRPGSGKVPPSGRWRHAAALRLVLLVVREPSGRQSIHEVAQLA